MSTTNDKGDEERLTLITQITQMLCEKGYGETAIAETWNRVQARFNVASPHRMRTEMNLYGQ